MSNLELREGKDRFKNELAWGTVHYTRFIASWVGIGGDMKHPRKPGGFRDWLRTLPDLSEEDIDNIMFIAENGKLELEDRARRFIEGQ